MIGVIDAGQRSAPRLAVKLGALLASLVLSGCEAPLMLDGVEKMRAQAVHRMDRYQAAARFETHVVVVGNQGVVLNSHDNGQSWQRSELPGWPALIDVAACADGAFYALAYEHKVYVSADRGKSWTEKPMDTEETPQSIACAPDGRLWVVGSYTSIWSSADGGDSWSATSRDEDAILTTVQFFDALNGIITGEFGTVLKTSDGGASWATGGPLPDEFYPQEAYFSDPQNGWVIGLGGTILHTADGGATWEREATGTQVSLFGIEAVGGHLFAVGGEGTLLRHVDGTWQAVEHGKPIRLYIRAILALDATHCLLGGVGGALHVVDTSGV